MHCITIPISVYLCKLKKGRAYRIMDKKKIGSVILIAGIVVAVVICIL